MKTGVRSSTTNIGRGVAAALVAAAVALGVLGGPAPLSATVPGEVDRDGVDNSGSVVTNLGGTYDWPYAVAVQPDDKVVVAGVSNAKGTHDFAVARYNPDLSLDATFGDGGTVLTDFGNSWDWARAVGIQPDGKIVVGGVSDASGSRDFALARYEPDGTLDQSFGNRGLSIVTLRPLTAETVHALHITPDGSILAGGVTFEDTITVGPNGDFMLARFDSNGRVDPAFGIGGLTTTDFTSGSYDEPYAMAVQPDGRIVLGGYTYGTAVSGGTGSTVPYGADDLAVARYRPDGLLDESFGRGGTTIVDAGTLDEEIHGLAVTEDGKIIAAGFVNGEQRGDMMLTRLHPDGSIDSGFGTEGFTVTAPLGSRSERLESLVVQPDGRLVVGGQIAEGPTGDFLIARYSADGALDEAFGEHGLRAVDFTGREDRVRAVAVQPDGKILGVGTSETDFGLVRLHG